MEAAEPKALQSLPGRRSYLAISPRSQSKRGLFTEFCNWPDVFVSLLTGYDVFVSLPTGYGKSYILPSVFDRSMDKKSTVFIIIRIKMQP